MVLLWLADIPYRRERAAFGKASGGKRRRLTLPHPQWLSDRFETAGINADAVSGRHADDATQTALAYSRLYAAMLIYYFS